MCPSAKQEDGGQLVPCVWMAAGVISYKLCDRAHDCESCPLDAALTHSPAPGPGVAKLGPPLGPAAGPDRAPSQGSTAGPRPPWFFPAGRRYSLSHLWVRRLSPDRLRVGVDALAALLLASVDGVAEQAPEPRLRMGQPVCAVHLLDGEVVIQSPVSGRAARLNETLADRPNLLVTAPYDEGWLFELSPPFDRDELARLLPASELQRLARLDIQRFQRRVALRLLQGTDRVGAARADGGEHLHDVRQMLGSESFLQIVQEALSLTPPGE